MIERGGEISLLARVTPWQVLASVSSVCVVMSDDEFTVEDVVDDPSDPGSPARQNSLAAAIAAARRRAAAPTHAAALPTTLPSVAHELLGEAWHEALRLFGSIDPSGEHLLTHSALTAQVEAEMKGREGPSGDAALRVLRGCLDDLLVAGAPPTTSDGDEPSAETAPIETAISLSALEAMIEEKRHHALLDAQIILSLVAVLRRHIEAGDVDTATHVQEIPAEFESVYAALAPLCGTNGGGSAPAEPAELGAHLRRRHAQRWSKWLQESAPPLARTPLEKALATLWSMTVAPPKLPRRGQAERNAARDQQRELNSELLGGAPPIGGRGSGAKVKNAGRRGRPGASASASPAATAAMGRLPFAPSALDGTWSQDGTVVGAIVDMVLQPVAHGSQSQRLRWSRDTEGNAWVVLDHRGEQLRARLTLEKTGIARSRRRLTWNDGDIWERAPVKAKASSKSKRQGGGGADSAGRYKRLFGWAIGGLAAAALVGAVAVLVVGGGAPEEEEEEPRKLISMVRQRPPQQRQQQRGVPASDGEDLLGQLFRPSPRR